MKTRMLIFLLGLGILILILSEDTRAETFTDDIIESFTDGTGYFKYTLTPTPDLGSLRYIQILSHGVYDASCPENWNFNIDTDLPLTSFSANDPSAYVQPGQLGVFELYSTNTEWSITPTMVRLSTWRRVAALTPAPEPTTFSLLALGSLALLRKRRA